MRDQRRVGVLISGRGSNMRALVEQARVATRSRSLLRTSLQAAGLDWARERGLPTWTWDSKGVEKEAVRPAMSAHSTTTASERSRSPGIMRLLSPWFIEQWRGRIVNIHPSLLPKYRGLDTHARALEAGDPSADARCMS